MKYTVMLILIGTMIQSFISALYLLCLTKQAIQRADKVITAWIVVGYNMLWGWYYEEFLGILIAVLVVISWLLIISYYTGCKIKRLPERMKKYQNMYLLDCYADNYDILKKRLLTEYKNITFHEKYRNLFFLEKAEREIQQFGKNLKAIDNKIIKSNRIVFRLLYIFFLIILLVYNWWVIFRIIKLLFGNLAI